MLYDLIAFNKISAGIAQDDGFIAASMFANSSKLNSEGRQLRAELCLSRRPEKFTL